MVFGALVNSLTAKVIRFQALPLQQPPTRLPDLRGGRLL